jgi:uncharacterized membrane protein YphA (DoxX/SURF4 family)
MTRLLETAQAISALGFLGYGFACLITPHMRQEFARYGLPKMRVLTGTLQILAAAGLFLGYRHPACALVSALGLSFMMLVALWVRLKIKDPATGFLQALACLFLNLFVFTAHLLQLLAEH